MESQLGRVLIDNGVSQDSHARDIDFHDVARFHPNRGLSDSAYTAWCAADDNVTWFYVGPG